MSAIQSIYVALFGRPADPGGLAYWTEVTNDGADLSVMLNTLPDLPEYQARFAGMTNAQIVNSIYLQLFGRDAEPEGLAYFTELLSSGAKNLGNIAVTIMQSAQGTDALEIEAKVAAADLFTAALDTPEEIAAYNGDDAIAAAKKFLDAVTKDSPATQEAVDAAVTEVVTGEPPSEGGGENPGTGPGTNPVDPTPPTPLELAQAEASAISAKWSELNDEFYHLRDNYEGGPEAVSGAYGSEIEVESPFGDTLGAAAKALNIAVAELGIQYAQLIEEFPSVALTGVFSFDIPGRQQTVHDNLLGNINAGALEARNLLEMFQEALDAIADGAYADRPWFGGYEGDVGGAAHDAVRAFDWARDIERTDGWVDTEYNATIDAAGINMPKGDMYSGSGNLTGNFHVVRHEGAGIEIALKAKPYLVDNGLMLSSIENGVVVYDVPEGAYAPNVDRAAWSFDWSITTEMNGAVLPADLDLVLYIDTDRGAGVNLTKVAVGSLLESYNNDKDLLTEDAPNNVFQNSWNFAFGFLNDMIQGDDYTFGPGLFDIKIAAEVGGVELVANTIRVNVGDAVFE